MKIDKNVPIPISTAKGEKGEAVRKMQISDSVFVTDRKDMSSYRAIIERLGFKPVSRKEGKGWRIWKTQRIPGD